MPVDILRVLPLVLLVLLLSEGPLEGSLDFPDAFPGAGDVFPDLGTIRRCVA